MQIQAWIHYGLAQLVSIFRRYDVAIEEYRQVIALAPQDPRGWRCVGFLQAQQGRTSEAIDSFGEALRIDPSDSNTRFNRAFLFHQAQRFDEAIPEFERVVADNPNNDRAWYGLGLCLEHQGALEKAVDALKEAAKIQYFNPHAAHHLALLYHRLGRHEELLAEYERVNGFDPKTAALIKQDTHL
jgi:tetratricopeptide (TPR) repeat protein